VTREKQTIANELLNLRTVTMKTRVERSLLVGASLMSRIVRRSDRDIIRLV